MKKFLTMLLALVMTISCFTGCNGDKKTGKTDKVEIAKEGYPIVKTQLEMSMLAPVMPNHSDPNTEMSFFKDMEKLTNIKMNIEAVPYSSFAEKKNLLFASDSYPDIIIGSNLTTQEEYSYGNEGILIPLQDLIAEYAPNLTSQFNQYPDVKKAITLPTGNIVAFPNIGKPERTGIWVRYYVNQNWLDKLGLKSPTSVDEWYNVLKAFKTQDPNGNGIADEQPICMFAGLNWLKRLVYNWGVNTNDLNGFYVDDNGKVQYAYIQPEVKEAFRFYKKLYAENLIDKETFTMTMEQFSAKAQAEDNVVGSFVYIAPEQATGDNLKRALEYSSVLPFKATNGKQIYPAMPYFTRGTAVITKNCTYPQAAVRWIDYLYGEKGAHMVTFGGEGNLYTWGADGKPAFNIEKMTENERAKNTLGVGIIMPSMASEYEVADVTSPETDPIKSDLNNRIKQTHTDLLPYKNIGFPQIYLDIADQKKIDLYNADISRFLDNSLVNFILGKTDIDTEWDTYVAELKKMGVEDMITVYQKAYESYSKN